MAGQPRSSSTGAPPRRAELRVPRPSARGASGKRSPSRAHPPASPEQPASSALALLPPARDADGMAEPLAKLVSMLTPWAYWAALIGVLAVGAIIGGFEGGLSAVVVIEVAFIIGYWRWQRWAVAPKKTSFACACKCLERLGDRRRGVRWRAANRLRGIGPESKELLPGLMAAMHHDDWMVRYHVIDAIGRLGPDAKPAVPALRSLVESKSLERLHAACALGKICDGDLEDEATAIALAMAASDNESGTRMFSAFAHWRVTRRTDVAVPVLVEVLRHESAPIRRGVPYLFARCGPAPPEILTVLRAALTDRDRSVRRMSAQVIDAANANDRDRMHS